MSTQTSSEKNNEKNSEWKEREIGALWKREGKNQSYLTGKLKDQQVIVFENTNKRSDKAPDFIMYESREMQGQGQGQGQGTSQPSTTEDSDGGDLL
jgi:hypothetical protein